MTMQKQMKAGFTLVELLVVISIIGMLAGLLLPAVNAARENGRRITCVSNQSNVALALLTYESARGAFPAMRKTIYSGKDASKADIWTDASWVGQILSNMEFNMAYEVLTRGDKFSNADANAYMIRTLPLPVMKCKSSGKSTSDASISYVVNGGYQNAYGSWTSLQTEISGYRIEPARKRDAVFFDHRAVVNSETAADKRVLCKETVSVDYISSHAGTSYVLLLSENLDAGDWITIENTAGTHKDYARSQGEEWIAFCYPINTHDDINSVGDDEDNPAIPGFFGTNPSTFPAHGTDDTQYSWMGYQTALDGADGASGGATGAYETPVFINQARTGYTNMKQYRKSRPSSNHPGVVVAAFADRGVRMLNETMDKAVFVRLCQPYSGVIIDGSSIQ